MKQGWETKKLGEVCEIRPPKKEAKERLNSNDLVTFLPMEDLGVLDRSITPAKQKTLKEVEGSYTYFANNDVLLAKITPCFENGKIGIARNLTNGVGFGSSEYIVLRNKGGISEEYLFYYLSRETFREEGRKNMTGAVGHKRVSREFIANYEIPLPPLPEQQRIVSILERCFAAIDKAKANAEQNLKNAKELFESYLQGVFENGNWETKTLGEIAFVKSGGTPLRHKTEYWSGDIAWYSSGELNNLYTTGPERHINELAIENSNAKLFLRGSLLIGMYDTAALKMSILDRDGTFNQAIAGVKPNPKIDLIFILHAINAIKPEILNLRRGVRQKNLSLEKIKNIPIPFPSLKEQQTIVRQLDALRVETQKLEAVYRKKIKDLEELRKSILQKAFSGQLSESGLAGLNDEQDLTVLKKTGKSLNQQNPDADKHPANHQILKF